MIYNTIIGTIFNWMVDFSIPFEVFQTLYEQIKGGIMKMSGN